MPTESFQFSSLSPANSLPFHGTLLRQNKSTLGPKKKSVKFLEIVLLSELVCSYHKLNFLRKKKKKKSCDWHFKAIPQYYTAHPGLRMKIT